MKNKLQPDVRFKGFTDDWEQRKLGDLLSEMKSGLSRMLSSDDIGLPVIRANNISNGKLNLTSDIKYWYKIDPQGANTSKYLIHKSDILVNFINSETKMGTAAYVDTEPIRPTIYTTNILRLIANENINSLFLFNLTFTENYKNYVKSITKPAVNQSSFTTVDLKKFECKVPIKDEQVIIGKFFDSININIDLHQQKIDELQNFKKSMLKLMFI